MWDCEHCGCQAIAGTITFCPMCFTPRPDVAAEPSPPDASAVPLAAGPDREAPQPLSDPEIGSVETEGNWGSP